VLLLDVTPLSLGIETLGGVFTKLVERNTTIPTEKKQVFSTAEDNQTAVTVRVFQGEREMAEDNRLLNQFNLEGIPPAPRGIPQIEVKFDIDQHGILNVSAKDVNSGKEQTVTIEQSSGLDEGKIEEMRKDAESHAEEDRKKREVVEMRNKAEAMCFELEKMIKDNEDKLGDSDKDPLVAAIAKTRELAAGDDVNAIKASITELEQASHALSKTLYEASAQAPPSGDAESAAEGDAGSESDDVIDADFEVKDS